MFIADGGSITQASGERHHQGSEGAVFDFPDSLIISTLLFILMLPVAGRKSLSI